MKDFLKYMLATIAGILCLGIFAFISSLMMMITVAAAGSQKPTLEDNSVLHISLNGSIEERCAEDPFAAFMGKDEMQTQGLDDLLAAIKVAKDNDDVKGIYLDGGTLSADFATLQELRKALLDFKQSKKFIIAYADSYMQSAYYIASVADKVYCNPSGIVDWHGIAAQPIFFKDLLEKLGVKMQVFKVGTYKSAVEPYILTQMSDANREQVQAYISDIWQCICHDVSASRKVHVDSLNAMADRYVTLAAAEVHVKNHLVDSLSYIDGVRAKLRSLTGEDEVTLVEAAEMARLYEPGKAKEQVAVYYAQGSIVDEATSNPFGGSESEIVGSKVVSDLDKLANDDDVKAVVLRINSGGGSAYASEQMWHAIQLLKAKKPVVVSMSGMAASGGYYMSCGADYIFAEPGTLTGSIGIFGMIPDATGLLTDKLGLHFDVVKTNVASDFGATGRPFNAEESQAMQNHINRGYALFLKRVADGRGMKTEQVDAIAQGRVWTGNQALRIKLVDKLGTLDDAVAEAARRAKVKDYTVAAYPAKASWMDNLLDKASGDDYMQRKVRTLLGVYYRPLVFATSYDGKPSVQARIMFEPNFK